MGTNFSNLSSESGGSGSILDDPSLSGGGSSLKSQFDDTSTLRTNMHDLFNMYLFQLRELMLGIAYGAPATDTSQAQLSVSKLLEDIGKVFARYYGALVGTAVTAHLKTGTRHAHAYFLISRKLLLERDPKYTRDGLNEEGRRYQTSFVELAQVLAQANGPEISNKDAMVAQFNQLAELIQNQAKAVMEGFNDTSLANFKSAVNHARGMADLLTLSITMYVNKSKAGQ